MKIKFICLVGATVLSASYLQSQNALSGKVTTSEGTPIPFALVSLKQTQLATICSYEGLYRFNSLKETKVVVYTRCLGYKDRTDTLLLNGETQFNPVLEATTSQLDEVVVNSTRVDKNSGMAFNNLDAEALKKQNLGQDAPYVLNQLPSVVVNSDAGNGVGYTGIRVRGSDATRVNVTINGVPVNDAESQGVFYVNMPDLVSSVNNIQVQRGIGASSNGAGAFGATINFQTNQLNEKAYAQVISTAGSFNTLRTSLLAGTGLLNQKFTLDARASRITSDGYIDRASSNLQSYYLAAGYYGKKSVLKFINFLGQEKTYQAWYYVPQDSIKRGNRTYNMAGEYVDANGKVKYYNNETDNYKQNNFQLHFIHRFTSRMSVNVTAHYTKGAGYYEQYKQNRSLSDYRLEEVITAKGDTIRKTDLIRRLWLDNDFAGGLFNLNYTANAKLAFTLGGGYNTYFGKHFGRVMWARYASNSEINHQYYLYTTNKNDGNVYLKTNYKPMSRLNMFLDVQLRQTDYRYFGYVNDLDQSYQNQAYVFFNPKAGLSYDLNSKFNVYASLAMAGKEPSGDDLAKNTPALRPGAEQMTDLELGARYGHKNLTAALNLYNMSYLNQLVLNGQIDNVGNPKHVNVKQSYRRGVELELQYVVNRFIHVGGNLTLSMNKIKEFTEYLDSSDVNYNYYPQHRVVHKNTDISYSPNQVSSLVVGFKPIKNMEVAILHKTVGRQYLDNTSSRNRSINPYQVLDLRFNYTFKTKSIPEIGLMCTVYNVLNAAYETNGYTYSSYFGSDLVTQNYLSPAARTNFLAGIQIKF